MSGDPVDVGDILGRDLRIRGLGFLGHVGLWTHGTVLEVVDDPDPIQTNPLQTFKAYGGYWGAKYGLGADHFNVIGVGLRQKNFQPQYTTSPYWTEGKFESRLRFDSKTRNFVRVWVLRRAKFRCDTFVNFCYERGTQVTICNVGICPAETYNRFPFDR